VLQTVYFDIIYPRESEGTARRLAEFADRDYEAVSSRLGISVGRRIPVAITPDIDEVNAFMNSMPYPHIMILDTPMSPEWTTFDDSLEKLFLHEMTHAVSLSTRSRALNFFHQVFGGWVYPPALNTPLFMTEGIAVSFESLDGYGRANDPLIKQKLRQEILENKFLNPHQVSGVSDMNIQGAWYEYGGLFSLYLQETYGMEKYAELWQAMGSGFRFSFFFYRNGFYHHFEKIYGLSVPDAWRGFRESLALSEIENSDGMIVSRGLPRTAGNAPGRITGMAAAGNRIFMLDLLSRQLIIYNGEQEKTERKIPINTSAYDLTVSAGGDSLLVSTYRYHNNRAEAVVSEYSAENGRPGRTWHGLYRGSYFRDGVVGIAAEGYRNRIVFRPGDSSGTGKTGKTGGTGDSQNEEVLLRGSGNLVFSNPRPIDDTWIAFTAARDGRRELGFYNYDTKQAYTAVTGLPDDRERWEFLRYLQVCEGRLLFGYNHDDRMYKLALIDPAGLESAAGSAMNGEVAAEKTEAEPDGHVSPTVLFTGRDFSGAVALPVLAGGAVYYRGSFFNTDRLMRYPEKLEDLGGTTAVLRLAPWKEAGEESAETAVIEPSSAGADPLPSKAYLPFKYLNPLNLWLPVPLIRLDSGAPLGFRVDGGGIYSVIIDPPESNTIYLQAAADARFSMVNYNITWTNRDLGVPVDFTISDGVTVDTVSYRALQINLQSTLNHSLGSGGIRGFLGAGFGFARFYIHKRGDTNSAYSWDFHSNSYKFMARLGLSSLTTMSWETFGWGYTAQAIGWIVSDSNPASGVYPRVDTLFQAAFEPVLPLRISLYGAWDSYTDGMNLQGQSSRHASPVFQQLAAVEYQNNDVNGLSWIAGGETEFRLFSLNVQRSLSHIYFNRFLGTLAYRIALFNAAGFSAPEGNRLAGDLMLTQSLVFRLGAKVSSAVLPAAPIKITAYLQAALKLSNLGRDSPAFTDIIAISPLVNMSY
jgi:hypothetical protein